VARVVFDVEGLAKTTVKARPSRTFGAQEDDISAELAFFTKRGARCEVVTEVWAAGSTDASPDTAAPVPPRAAAGMRPASRSVTSHVLDPGLSRLRHNWRAPRAGAGTYRVSVQVSLRGRPVWESVLSYYNLGPADIDRLEERYRRAVGRAKRRLYASLPSVAARLQWVRDLYGTLDPGEDPEPLRLLFEETAEMVSDLEAGQDPLAGVTGHQRRAFRSGLDGSLQPYSVHVPPQAAVLAREPKPPQTGLPLLVMLHESGVDDTAAAREPPLIRHLDKYGWLLCAPFGRGRSRWYVGDSGRDVLEAVEAAETTLPVDRKSVFLAGFSMGGFGALTVGLSGLRRFTGLVVLSGFTAPPAETGPQAEGPDRAGPDRGADDRQLDRLFDRAEGVPVFVAHGTHDPSVPVARVRELVRRLQEAGAMVTYRELEGAGHGGYDVWAEVFEWLEQVRQEVRG
jgi:predicted esterase